MWGKARLTAHIQLGISIRFLEDRRVHSSLFDAGPILFFGLTKESIRQGLEMMRNHYWSISRGSTSYNWSKPYTTFSKASLASPLTELAACSVAYQQTSWKLVLPWKREESLHRSRYTLIPWGYWATWCKIHDKVNSKKDMKIVERYCRIRWEIT